MNTGSVPRRGTGRRKYVYTFGGGRAEGHAGMRDLLGGKGANLAEMSQIGLPVPPGFTISTDVCRYYYANGRTLPAQLAAQVGRGVAHIEKIMQARFGDPERALLLSVRSGAQASMPGMMDTVLNLGLNRETVRGLADSSGDPRFSHDSHRRFIQMYASVVLGLDHGDFEELLERSRDRLGVSSDSGLGAGELEELAGDYLELVRRHGSGPFPEDPGTQLWGAISAVLDSWMSDRAQSYRQIHDIPHDWGTAVTVQAMVFGNRGAGSCTGVVFTRNPTTGERKIYGEYLPDAQGEDVVAGIRTPRQLSRAARVQVDPDGTSMEEDMPGAYRELLGMLKTLERHYRDMQDVEFTVQEGRLWLLQTRSGKRSVHAAIRIAVDMVRERLITREKAIARIDPASLEQLLHPMPDPAADRQVIARGIPASPGAASGVVVFSPAEAVRLAGLGQDAILVRIETSPEDIQGMHVARGILTSRGGATSHAAVVARGMGRPCITGAGSCRIDYRQNLMEAGGVTVRAGDAVTIDGSSGEVILGTVPTVLPVPSPEFGRLMSWADRIRRMAVRANAETPEDARTARALGAAGIGLCRTEHMFFQEDRITAMRRMIMASNSHEREQALAGLLPMQRADFVAIFRAMATLPVTIRLLDPPLHEFLPGSEADTEKLARLSGVSVASLRRRRLQLEEANPMLGHRGCRLGISYPEIYRMQTRAIFEAAAIIRNEDGVQVRPEIMIPLVSCLEELRVIREDIRLVAEEVRKETGIRTRHTTGIMIELPRAALRAQELAEMSDFFSFGTNDLTQTTLGISRDDASSFLNDYIGKGIYTSDPFSTLDIDGVGALVSMAVNDSRKVRHIKTGICGEHGGDPRSILFFGMIGLDYVSCSPYRVPVARLAAAQAALSHEPGEPGQEIAP